MFLRRKPNKSGSTSVQVSSSRLGDIGWRIPSAGKGFMPFHKKDPTAEKWSNRLERNRSNIIFGRAWSPSLHWHVPSSSLFCWDPMLPLIIRLFTQSRRAYWAAERIRVRGWDRWEAFGLMRRAQKIVRRWGSLFEAVRLWQECRLFNSGSKLKAVAYPKRYLHDQNQPLRSVKHWTDDWYGIAGRLQCKRPAIAVESQTTKKHFLLQQGRAFALRGGAILTTNN